VTWNASSRRPAFTSAFGTLVRGAAGARCTAGGTRTLTNAALCAGVDDAIRAVERGEPVAEALRGTPPAGRATAGRGRGERHAGRHGARVADTYDAESQRALRSLVALVEPALIVGFGAVVGFVALAMLQAIYSINAAVL
jgi:uncharacterized membrane protein